MSENSDLSGRLAEMAKEAASRAGNAAKGAAGQFADRASDAAKDAAQAASRGATKAALGAVSRMQNDLSQRLEEQEKASRAKTVSAQKDADKNSLTKKNSDDRSGSSKKSKVPRIAAGAVLALVIVFGLGIALVGPGKGSFLSKEDFVTTSQLEEAIDIDELSTAEFVYNGIAEQHKEGSDDIDFRISYDATVKAGINMGDVRFDIDDEAKVVRPHLPKVVINNISVNVDSVNYMPENPGGDIRTILKTCEQDILNEANNSDDFRITAEENLQAVIEALTMPILKEKGYTIEWVDAE